MPSNSNPFWLRYTPQFIRQRLEGRATLHAIIHNTGWLLGDKALRLGLGLLVGAWVARYLGPSQYGELTYVVAFVAFFQTITLLGLNSVAIRDMARDREASPVILGTVFRLRLITGFFCWLAGVAAMALFRPGDTDTLILTAVVAGTVIFQAADTIDLWFQSQTQSRRTVVAKAIAYVLNSMLKIGLILVKAPLLYFALAMLMEFSLAAIALYVSYRIYPAPFSWKWDMEWAQRLLKESWPYMISGLAIMVYIRVDQIMLREMCGVHELGIFSAALPLSTTWYFIPMMISQSAGPSIAKKKLTDPAGYEYALNRLFSMMWWMLLPLSICIALFSSPVVHLLYGDAYTESASVLAIHVFANIPVGLGVMQSIWILNERRNTLSLKKTVIGAITNIGMNLVLIPRYGAIGAAISTLFSTLISGVLTNLYFAPKIFKRQVMSLFGV
ncbi:O-unit flippase [Prosthecochloris sp. ZM]|uniref:flippase n=1 Tax=Prosthecochloris sp. ZM TaxID=2283143 RepID=UPI000DF7EE93|nr:flippase [Prosthecochloris sp. ZM]RDD29676.1 O-unit flippase [Prosthecochloris sp. ZM]